MLKFIKDLDGHSGCKISLFEKNGYLFIRKKSSSKEYNIRLKKQYIKQKKYNLDIAKTPEIYGCGIDNDLFFFDMEYVSCVTFCEYINTVKITKLIEYIKLLFESLAIKESIKNENVNKIFNKKIISLKKSMKNSNKIVQQAFKLLQTNNWESVYQSPSHGDLTLENILISNDNKIYLIDFLDTFFSSWMIDIAKIFQDLEVKWSFRNMEYDVNRNLRILIAKETLIEMIISLDDGKNLLIQIYKILLLNLLRIIPYTKDNKTKKFLNNAIKNVIQIINDRSK